LLDLVLRVHFFLDYARQTFKVIICSIEELHYLCSIKCFPCTLPFLFLEYTLPYLWAKETLCLTPFTKDYTFIYFKECSLSFLCFIECTMLYLYSIECTLPYLCLIECTLSYLCLIECTLSYLCSIECTLPYLCFIECTLSTSAL